MYNHVTRNRPANSHCAVMPTFWRLHRLSIITRLNAFSSENVYFSDKNDEILEFCHFVTQMHSLEGSKSSCNCKVFTRPRLGVNIAPDPPFSERMTLQCRGNSAVQRKLCSAEEIRRWEMGEEQLGKKWNNYHPQLVLRKLAVL